MVVVQHMKYLKLEGNSNHDAECKQEITTTRTSNTAFARTEEKEGVPTVYGQNGKRTVMKET